MRKKSITKHTKHTTKSILETAKKYKSRSEWAKNDGRTYVMAFRWGISDQATQHMGPSKKTKLTNENILKTAKKYNTRSEWQKNDRRAYSSALSQGISEEATKHMGPHKTIKWTKENILEAGKRYTTRMEWEKNDGGTYRAAHYRGIFDSAVEHMGPRTYRNFKWTKENVLEEAKKYKTKQKWIEENNWSYKVSVKKGWYEEACSHMAVNARFNWTKELLIEDAKKYETILKWRQNSSSAYQTARGIGVFKEATSHMPEVFRWTESLILADAKKYNSRTDWRASGFAHVAAKRLGIYDQAVKHMERLGNLDKRMIYCFHSNNKAYIGLTFNLTKRMADHKREGKQYIYLKNKYDENAIEWIQLTDYVDQEKAAYLEGYYIKSFRKKGYTILNEAEAGGLGGHFIKWTKEKILADALLYPSRKQWKKYSKSAFQRAKRTGCFDEVTAHMPKNKNKNKNTFKWTKEAIFESIKGFQYISHWRTRYPQAAVQAKKQDCYEEVRTRIDVHRKYPTPFAPFMKCAK